MQLLYVICASEIKLSMSLQAPSADGGSPRCIVLQMTLTLHYSSLLNILFTSITSQCFCGKHFACLGRYLNAVAISGSKVSETIRTGIVDIVPYANQTELLLVGNVATLSGELRSTGP